jgi:dihydrodipicolinate reductase
VGFDAPGESVELRITARDRSAYVAGALLASDWLREDRPHPVGIYPFESVVRAVLTADPASTAPPTAAPGSRAE